MIVKRFLAIVERLLNNCSTIIKRLLNDG